MLVSLMRGCAKLEFLIFIQHTHYYVILLEWPLFFTGDQSNRKKTKGNINILQLASNVTDYTIVLELYNFANSEFQLEGIGSKLAAIFSLPVYCVTGCNHKADYTSLKKQYSKMQLPVIPENKMHDVSLMAINRGVVKRGRGTSGLQSLCRKQGLFLRKPENVRVGTCFNSKNGSLSMEAQKYCQLDAEAPLKLHSQYEGMIDLTKRIGRDDDVPTVGTKVDIMPESGTSILPIATGIVQQVYEKNVSDKWESNGLKLRAKQVLVLVTQVYDAKGIIHYPHDSRTIKKCSCGRGSHGKIQDKCDFYMYSQFGKPPFTTVELLSRLRLHDDSINYPKCIYDSELDIGPDELSNFTCGDVGSGTVDVDGVEDVVDDEEGSTDNTAPERLSRRLLEVVDDEERRRIVDDDEVDGESTDNLSEEEIRIASDIEFNKTLEKLIEEADVLSEDSNVAANHEPSDTDVPIEDLPMSAEEKRVLGDAFHLMDRAKLPMHHEYKALFFRSLRAAMFIMHREDVEEVKEVLKNKPGTSWEKKMAFDFGYISKRVRRRIPPPTILHNRMKAVFDFFKDKVDSKTGKVLFNDANRERFENVLDLVKKGYGSDPKNLNLYVPKTDSMGRNMVDKDGLQLYRSLRGTSNLESLHQYLTTSFGHTYAGPMYCDTLLLILRHMYNWRMSKKNRPFFPNVNHYDGLLIDRINNLYELIYGFPKYRNWMSFNDNLPTEESPFGIVPITPSRTSSITASEEDKEALKKNKMLSYLAQRQKSPIPFMPIRGESEKRLVHRKLNEAVSNNNSLTNQSIFDSIADDWNSNEINVAKKRYPKLPSHFSKYLKRWRKNQDRRDAEIYSGSNRLSTVLERIPESINMGTFESRPLDHGQNSDNPTEISPTQCSPATDNAVVEQSESTVEQSQAMVMLSNIAGGRQPVATEVAQPNTSARKRTRTCQVKGCTNPSTCSGSSRQKSCPAHPDYDPSKKVKRTVTNKGTPKCFTCGLATCKTGISQRDRCPHFIRTNNT